MRTTRAHNLPTRGKTSIRVSLSAAIANSVTRLEAEIAITEPLAATGNTCAQIELLNLLQEPSAAKMQSQSFRWGSLLDIAVGDAWTSAGG